MENRMLKSIKLSRNAEPARPYRTGSFGRVSTSQKRDPACSDSIARLAERERGWVGSRLELNSGLHDQIQKAVEALRQGGIVAYPTDTAYGLAVDATNPKAVEKLYKLKGRDFNKPIHVIYPSTQWLKKIVKLNIQALRLMVKFMPGPITLVLPLKAIGFSWKRLSAGTKTMGIRLPNHPVALELVKKFGKPITTTSANVSGKPNTYSISEVKKQFARAKNKPHFYLDGGKLAKTQPSTVVLVNKNVTILREGPVTETQIKKALK